MALNTEIKSPVSLSWWQSFIRRPEFLTLSLIIALSTIISIVSPSFLSVQSLFDLLRSTVRLGMFALGVLLVLAAGGIDVSFTAIGIVALYSTTKAVMAIAPNAPFILPLIMAVTIGVLLGLFNGFIVDRFRAPSLIVTIGTLYLFHGALLAFVGTKHITALPAGMKKFGRSNLIEFVNSGGVKVALPTTVLVFALAALLTWWILNHTMMGRAIFAVGGSVPIADRLGISVRNVYLFIFGYAGFLAGLGGIMHGSSNRLANPFDLVGGELDVIAAVVLGGARITGGHGSVFGTVLGVILLVIIHNSLILVGIPSTWQKVVVGVIVLFASGMFSGVFSKSK